MNPTSPQRPHPLIINPDHLSRAHGAILDPPFPTAPSHSSSHCLRVHNLALQLYSSLPPATFKESSVPLLRLVALLHDIADHKYLPSNITSSRKFLLMFLTNSIHLNPDVADYVAFLCDNVSYSKQVKSAALPAGHILELDLVRDADRLDAIGATGIARCFSYGGERGHSLAEQRSHFDEKLLKIYPSLHTEPARRIAKERQQIMMQFIKAFDEEMARAARHPTLHDKPTRFNGVGEGGNQ